MGFAGIGKTTIISLNSTFLLLSLGLLVIGLLVEYNQDILNDILGIVTNFIQGSLDSLKQSAGRHLPDSLKTSVTADQLKTMIKELLQNISVPLIAVSASFLVISGSGLLGGCFKSNCLLILYIVFLVSIILAEAAFLAMFLVPGTATDTYIKTAMRSALQFNKYNGTYDKSIISKIWTVIMDSLDCCGLETYADFKKTSWWDNRGNMSVPIACCRNMTQALEEKFRINSSPNCTVRPTTETTSIGTGCYSVMRMKMFESRTSVGIFSGVWSILFLVELLLMVSAIAMVKEGLEKNNKVHPEPRRRRER